MTILEALERAKRLRGEKSQEAPRQSAEPTSSPVTARKSAAVEPVGPVLITDFAQLPVDLAACENNRILFGQGHATSGSAVLDSYRILRTQVGYRGQGQARYSSLGIVSAGPGEGKTLTALNLSLAFARERKHNIFLLDLDLRNPSVCRYLGVTPKVGLGSVLSGEANPADAFFTVGIDNLFLAGGTTSYSNSSELLGGKGFLDLLAYLHSLDRNALLIVDLPPVLLSADALVVGPSLAGVLLIVAEGITRRDKLSVAVESLSGSNVAGIVLNRSRELIRDYYG